VAKKSCSTSIWPSFTESRRDFLFRLTASETTSLKSQIVISKSGRGGRRHAPFAFTEHGAIMAATVLYSPRAVHMSILVVRAFVQLRESSSAHRVFASKLAELERKVAGHSTEIAGLFAAPRTLLAQPPATRRGIGFTADIARKST
jgi:hypothetical protein